MDKQKKQLIIITIATFIFCIATMVGIVLVPVSPSNAASFNNNYSDVQAPSNIVAPKKVEGLVYNGRSQSLIIAGQNDIVYSLDKINFSSYVPKAVQAGGYNIYYKIAGDEMIYSIYNIIEPKKRTLTVNMSNWNYTQAANEPEITLIDFEDTIEPQITYYQGGQKLYRKPSAVGDYKIEVSVPASANYQACTVTKDFSITSQVELLFDASLSKYKNVIVNLGTQTQTVDLTLYSRTKIFNALNGAQTLSVVTTDGEVIFQKVINPAQNQQIKVKG